MNRIMRRSAVRHPAPVARVRYSILMSLLGLMALLAEPAIHGSAHAQVVMEGPAALSISSAQKAEVIDSLTGALREVYVFPDVARDMERLVRNNLKNGAYDDIDRLGAFCIRLTEDFQSVSHDRHIGVDPIEPRTTAEADPDAQAERERQQLAEWRYSNYAFRKIEILPENLGYLDFRGFIPAEYAGATAVAAMNFLANTDGIVFDMRNNGGGSPSMIQLIISYLVPEATHINSFYIRKDDTTQQFWTSVYVPGPRLTDIPVYVLTSSRTFSAAEEFVYNLKNMKRGTIVGETTGGGAHPVEGHWFRIDDERFVSIRVPYGRAINPITGTNWEGTGIEPDIAVAADLALETARLDFIEKRLDSETEETRRGELAWSRRAIEVQLNPVTVPVDQMHTCVGTYGPRVITWEDDALYYQRKDRPRYRLFPMGDDIFGLEGLDYFRLQFVRAADGSVDEVVGLYDNGFRDGNKRSDTARTDVPEG